MILDRLDLEDQLSGKARQIKAYRVFVVPSASA
jgi:hypothetical protein